MAGLVDSLMEQLNNKGAIEQIAGRLGVDPAKASSAVSAAVPALLAGLAKNAEKPEGAAALAGALERDHDGSVLDDDQYFEHYEEKKPGGILGHVFGEKTGAVESQVSALGGLGGGQGADLMKMLAPLVMGYLGKEKSSGGLDIGSLSKVLAGGGGGGAGGLQLPGGLGEILGGLAGGTSNGKTSSAKSKSPLGGILGKLMKRK
jgi:hypothetical protein